MLDDDDGLALRTIGEIVKERRACRVVSFDPDTFAVGFHDVTGWYEGPEDKIYEVRLASGRSVRVTAGHNLFTLGSDGEIRKVRTGELTGDIRVAVPQQIPEVSTAIGGSPGGRRLTSSTGARLQGHRRDACDGARNCPTTCRRWSGVGSGCGSGRHEARGADLRPRGSARGAQDRELPGWFRRRLRLQHRRLHRRRFRRAHHVGAVERGQLADHALPRHEDRPGELPADDHAGRRAVRHGEAGVEVPGQRGPTPSRYWENFRE